MNKTSIFALFLAFFAINNSNILGNEDEGQASSYSYTSSFTPSNILPIGARPHLVTSVTNLRNGIPGVGTISPTQPLAMGAMTTLRFLGNQEDDMGTAFKNAFAQPINIQDVTQTSAVAAVKHFTMARGTCPQFVAQQVAQQFPKSPTLASTAAQAVAYGTGIGVVHSLKEINKALSPQQDQLTPKKVLGRSYMSDKNDSNCTIM